MSLLKDIIMFSGIVMVLGCFALLILAAIGVIK